MSEKQFNPLDYNIVVKKEQMQLGVFCINPEDNMYVATVTELPDLAIYAKDYATAYQEVIEAITERKKTADRMKRKFPSPNNVMLGQADKRYTYH